MKSAKLTMTIFASILALTTVLPSCATQYVHHHYEPQFLPETADSATPAVCRVVLVQDEPFVVAKKTSATIVPYTATGGLIDIFTTTVMNAALQGVNKGTNKIREDKAAKMGASLAGHGLGASFRNDFQSALSAALGSSSWLHTMPLEITRENKQVTVEQHPVVQIDLIYHLSYDASALIVQAHLGYFRPGQTKAAYTRYYNYYSEAIGPERDDSAVAKWVSSDQDLLRKRMGEGMSEVIAMLKLDFLNPSPTFPTDPGVKISCYDPLSLDHVQWEGHILRKGNPRILFREKTGNLFSIVPDQI